MPARIAAPKRAPLPTASTAHRDRVAVRREYRWIEHRDFHPATGGAAWLLFEPLPASSERPRICLGVFDSEAAAAHALDTYPDAD